MSSFCPAPAVRQPRRAPRPSAPRLRPPAPRARWACPCRPRSCSAPRSAATTSPRAAGCRRICASCWPRTRAARGGDRAAASAAAPAAAGLGAFRRAGVDAGHDGDDPQHRAHRADPARAAARSPGTRAWCGTATGGWSATSPRSCTGARRRRSTRSPSATARERGVASARELDSATPRARICAESLETALVALPGQPFPAGTRRSSSEPRWRPCSAPGTATRPATTAGCNGIDDATGTAVTVQAMVFGNGGSDIGRGRRIHARSGDRRERALSRLPLQRAGRGRRLRAPRRRTTRRGCERRLPPSPPSSAASRPCSKTSSATCRTSSSRSRTAGSTCCRRARASVRPGPRCASPSTWCARGVITPREALARLDGLARRIERTRLARDASARAARHGPSPPASASQRARSSSTPTGRSSSPRRGRPVILVRPDIATEDIEGIAAAEGVLTAAGGRTSHAAVVARQLGKVCLVGCPELAIEADGRGCTHRRARLPRASSMTLDGDAGASIGESCPSSTSVRSRSWPRSAPGDRAEESLTRMVSEPPAPPHPPPLRCGTARTSC